MTTTYYTGFACFYGKDSDPAPAIGAAGTFFLIADNVGQSIEEAKTAFRLAMPSVSLTPGQVSDVQLIDTSSGGGGNGGGSADAIAEDYNPGTPDTPESGTDFTGQAFTNSAAGFTQ